MTDAAPEHLYLIDGSSYIFRAYHALPPMTRDDGTPVNAVLGFCNMLFKLLQDLEGPDQPTHLAVIFDAGRRTFRNDVYPEYKAHRPPAPDDLIPQFPIIRESVKAFNVPAIDSDGYEADDIIATYAINAAAQGYNVTIVSSDKDLMQLVTDQITMFDSMKNRHIGVDEVIEKFGVGPDRVVDIQALAGDSADNVPGIPGIGMKTAAQLINEYGDLENLLDRAEEIKQPKRRQNLIENADLARISRDLVTLKVDVPDLPPLESMKLHGIQIEPLMHFLEEQNFRSLQSKVISHMGGQAQSALPYEAQEIAPETVTYETVTTSERLQYWIDAAYKAGQIAVDTETTDLNAMRAKLVGISLSIEAGKACYIPLAHVGEAEGELAFDGGGTPDQIDMDMALSMLKPLFVDPSVLKIGQNIKYDLTILANTGLHISPYDDTMLLSYTLDAGRGGHGMDELAEKHLDHKTIPFKDVTGTGKKQITFDQVPLDKATEYAAEDADITGRLHRLLKPRLVEEKMTTVYETLERPLPQVLMEMEKNGVKVDQAILARLSADFAERLNKLEEEIHTLAGHPFNIASPKQLGDVLFGEMGLSGGKKNKTGAFSTNAEVLDNLAAEGHELPTRILDWRQLAKLKSTYTDALQKEINTVTGRIHTSYSLAATTTGRLASTNPNLQNIPIRTEEGRKIRQAFIAESGYTLMAADYSQIELRLLAHIADLASLKEAFHQGQDIHAMTASQVFGVPIEGMDPVTRRKAKAINFGIIYGISAFGLARQLGISRTEAKDYIDAYFTKFPGIQQYMEDTKTFCRNHGYVETIFGRRCHINGLQDKNGANRAFAERAAINAPIQGAAADIIRRAMIRLPDALATANLNARMLLQVHDELVFEVPDGEMDQTIRIVKKVMEAAAAPAVNLSVPLIVDTGMGHNWDEAH